MSISRYRHVLWTIENHPGYCDYLQSYMDIAEYPDCLIAAARKAWSAFLGETQSDPAILFNAGVFFLSFDYSEGKSLILRADALDPENGSYTLALCQAAYANMHNSFPHYAEDVIQFGKKSLEKTLPYDQAVVLLSRFIAEASLSQGDAAVAMQFAKNVTDIRFQAAVEGVKSLTEGDVAAAEQALLLMRDVEVFDYPLLKLADDLVAAGRSNVVAEFLSCTFDFAVSSEDVVCWLAGLRNGLHP